MATTLDWSQCPAVESIPGKVSLAAHGSSRTRERRFRRCLKIYKIWALTN